MVVTVERSQGPGCGRTEEFARYVVDSAMTTLIFIEHLLEGGPVNEK